MELVVGASEATMKSLLAKLGGLLAQEYTLITGVNGDLQYINDELATMQSFLRDLTTVAGGHGHRMKDWMKQIRDITYDIEDCIDDSADRLHGVPTDTCCYFLVNRIHEILTWWPRRQVATRISILKMRAQQIGERRDRYGINNPDCPGTEGSGAGSSTIAGFDAADNQDESRQLVAVKDPVGVEEHMGDLDKCVTYIVGFGGVGKTAIATALYRKYGDRFGHRAMVTVSQSSDLETILRSIENQVKPPTSNQQTQGGSGENRFAAAVKGARDQVSRGTSAIMAKFCSSGASEEDRTKLDLLKNDLAKHLKENSYLILIDDVWSATTLDYIINKLPNNKDSRIIVTTRFHAVATTRREGDIDIRKVKGLADKESEELFTQAFLESKGSKYVTRGPQAPGTTSKIEEADFAHNIAIIDSDKPVQLSEPSVSEPSDSKDVTFPDKVWKMCGGLPLAIVTMAGHVACNPHRSQDEWLHLCSSLFSESGKDHGKDGGKEITQEEVGRIVSHCYNDMPAEIKTCSLYLSIFPKGQKISRKRLTRRWIAESFVCEKQGLSVEDVAETYFNHLIRRKIIRPVEHSSNGKVKKFIVHDMVLEHIVAKASEENFITVVGGNWLMQPPSSKVRRLSLQGGDSKHAKDTEKMNLSHVRSVTMFGSLNQMSSHSFKFGIVQVLDLEGCTGLKGHHTEEICKMVLLKYLSLRRTDTKRLPKTIGKLENLETLDIRETNVVELPKTVCQLERLVNILGGDKRTRKALKIPEELSKKKKMKSLRILSGIEIIKGSADLHHLTELRKLAIYKLKTIGEDATSKDLEDLSSSIEYLGGHSLRTLVVDGESSEFTRSLDDLSTPPKFLVALEISGKIIKVPSWITELTALTKVTLSVTAFRTDNLKVLSNLEALFCLSFSLMAANQDAETLTILAENKLHSNGEVIVPDGGFKSLKLLRFSAPLLPLLSFSKDAMPELERLELQFSMLEGLFGVENLAELKVVHMTLEDKDGEDMTKKVAGELDRALKGTGGKTPKIIVQQ